MFNVSVDYLDAIRRPAIRTRVYGTIGNEVFSDENILEGSLSIANQNSGNDNVQIGTVYIGELSVTLRGLRTARYNMAGVAIQLYFELLLGDRVTWEMVPLGRYYVGEANHTRAGVEIKAYDVMSKLDKGCRINVAAGKPYQLAKMACEACFVDLATSQEVFASFANGSETLSLWQEGTDIKTWRDFLSWVAQSCACYVTANRYGKVEFRQYGRQVTDTVGADQRFEGAAYSDYETRYTGLYCTNIEDSTMDYYGLAQDDGLTYSLGENPFLQYGTKEGKEILRRAILNRIALIDYVPFSASLPENPAYDLGDVLSFPGGYGDADKLFCINKIVWTYHRGITIEGVGENPALTSAQSKVDKNIAGLLSKISGDTMHYYDITNVESIVINNGETREILNLRYVTTKDTHIDFHAELRMYVDALEEIEGDDYTEHDVTGTVSYYINDALESYNPIVTELDGIQLRHLVYFWKSTKDIIGFFRVELTADGGSITIPAGCLTAYWAGEGLVGDTFDNSPMLTDNLEPFAFHFLRDSTDSVETEIIVPGTSELSDNVDPLSFSTFASFTDLAGAEIGASVTVHITNFVARLNVPVSSESWTASADGQFIETVDLTGVTGFSSLTGGALAYLCSFDGGDTWMGWDNGWQEDLEMTLATIGSLTSAEFGDRSVRFKAIFDAGESCGGFIIKGGHA